LFRYKGTIKYTFPVGGYANLPYINGIDTNGVGAAGRAVAAM
jgi:hypothetical protein